MYLAKEAAKCSPCANKQLGVVLILADGETHVSAWNGPPTFVTSCVSCKKTSHNEAGADMCAAIHAERSAILKAARKGLSTDGSTLYCAFGVPCKNCFIELMHAGVKEIVIDRETWYDELSKSIANVFVFHGGKLRVRGADGELQNVRLL